MYSTAVRAHESGRQEHQQGTLLIVGAFLLVLLMALATSLFVVVQKNVVQARFFSHLNELRRYAGSGVNLAIHELTYEVTGSDGNLGTERWSPANDAGRDGKPATLDEGEGNGIPTPGEPNLISYPVGPVASSARLLVRTTDTAWPNVKHIVATAFNGDVIANVEVYAKGQSKSGFALGAAYVESGSELKLGGALLIDGHDWNPDGTPGSAPPVHGIATGVGDPPGTNASQLALQVGHNNTDQILGLGPNPSIGEVPKVDLDSLFDDFKSRARNVVPPGGYSNVSWGNYDANDLRVTYCDGDLALSGTSKGAGVLCVEGSLTLTGKTNFVGLIIVRGDVKLSGGGNEVQVYGSLVASNPSDLNFVVTGNPVIRYSSEALAKAFRLLGATYKIVYWSYRS